MSRTGYANASMKNQPNTPERPLADGSSRRNFIKGSGLILAGSAIVGGQLKVARAAHVFGSDTIKLGLVGCGDRGTSAAIEALNTSQGLGWSPRDAASGEVRLTAMADVFSDQLQSSYRTIKSQHPSRVDVDEARFVGLDAYQQLLNTDVDVVILATPPGFRPMQFEAAIAAGKHVFMEKPVATDAPGVRRVLAAGELAKEKGLAVQVGLQRRHEVRYRQCIDQLHSGIIGDPIFARAYWNGSGAWSRPRTKNQTELEYQLRNWYYFNWLCGDHINEQHIHNLDVINWLMKSHPVEAQGQGGREVRKGENTGEIYDHHMVEYVYEGGTRLLSQCRHIPGCRNTVGEHVHCTGGSCDLSAARIHDARGKLIWSSDAKEGRGKGWQQEHVSLFASLRSGDVPNETEYAAHSTMTAIMGRLATYSGKLVKWNEAIQSNRSLADTDTLKSLDHPAPVQPTADGHYAAAVPGKTKVL